MFLARSYSREMRENGGAGQVIFTKKKSWVPETRRRAEHIERTAMRYISQKITRLAPRLRASNGDQRGAMAVLTANSGTMALANSDCKGTLPLPSDCNVAAAISVSGSTNISFSGASIISNSSSTSAISVQTGSLAVGLNAYASGTDSAGNNGTMTVSG